MMEQYLFEFEPIDSFSFSGETSAQTIGVKHDPFFNSGSNDLRRQSFRVETDHTPPQTTVMGAIRRMLLSQGAEVGTDSFDLANDDTQPMGIIENISPVFLLGNYKSNESEDETTEVLCIPAPETVKHPENEAESIPFHPRAYSAKEYCPPSWIVYPIDNLTSPFSSFLSEESIFKTYEQTITHIGNNSKVNSYHLQCKCRMQNTTLKHAKFGVIVGLNRKLEKNVEPMLLPLGSKDSRFCVTCEPTSIDLSKATLPNCYEQDRKYWCASLLSAAYLPEEWRETQSLEQAKVTIRNMRCAKSDEKYQLKLIPQRLVFADKRSVFLFATEADRNAFAEALERDRRKTCGLNCVLRYEIGSTT